MVSQTSKENIQSNCADTFLVASETSANNKTKMTDEDDSNDNNTLSEPVNSDGQTMELQEQMNMETQDDPDYEDANNMDNDPNNPNKFATYTNIDDTRDATKDNININAGYHTT